MYLTKRFYIVLAVAVILCAAGFWLPVCLTSGIVLVVVLALATVADTVALYYRKGIDASREMSDRFSCGDENEVRVNLLNNYAFPVKVDVVDEIPVEFQRRDIDFKAQLSRGGTKTILYTLTPKTRGEYNFGRIRVFVKTPLALAERRISRSESTDVKVYPSYLQLRHYQLLAMSDNLTEQGIKRIRRPGNNTDFEHIREYVTGDDYRTINWKATARRNQLMVNVYQQEKSQQVYCVIDKGRVMQQAFDGMTLLDRAINASLILSYVSIQKEDKAGIITFEKDFDSFVAAERGAKQMPAILENLYKQQSTFGESDYSALLVNLRRLVTKRSLIILYTNFLNHSAMLRQLPYLRQIVKTHCVLVVFFEDREMKYLAEKSVRTDSDYYTKMLATRIEYEKRYVVSTLMQNGIYALLTPPESLTVNVVNRYLEMKARHLF